MSANPIEGRGREGPSNRRRRRRRRNPRFTASSEGPEGHGCQYIVSFGAGLRVAGRVVAGENRHAVRAPSSPSSPRPAS